MRRPEILIVESDPDLAYALTAVLEFHGYKPACATSAREGLELTAGRVPALMLVENHLADGSGAEFLQACRDHPMLAAVPAVLMASPVDVNPERWGTPVLRHPFEMSELLEVVRRQAGSPLPPTEPEA